MKGEWEGDEIPASYLLQCQHYMAVTGYEAWWIAVLVGGNKFIHKRIERDEELIDYLINIEKEFWENHVLANNPPPFDGSVASSDLLKAMYPQHEPDSTIELTSDLQVYIDSYKVLESEKKELELKMTECQNVIKVQGMETKRPLSMNKRLPGKRRCPTGLIRAGLRKNSRTFMKLMSNKAHPVLSKLNNWRFYRGHK